MKKISWGLFVFLAIFIGVFPFICYALNIPFGITSLKNEIVLSNLFWKIGFHTHIIFAAIALLIGWLQFIPKLRSRNIALHRTIGKIYVVAVLTSALASLFVSFYANGGFSAFLGLFAGGLVWFTTTYMSYYYVRHKRIEHHKKMAIYSYATTFGGVTLRIWLPILATVFNDFDAAYNIVTWLAWAPNIIVAYFINARSKPKVIYSTV
jgi:uncharacterized membrane protein